LGLKAELISCLGNDEAGRELMAYVADRGVGMSGVQMHSTAPTRQVYVLRQVNGDRVFAGFGEIATDKFADAFLDAAGIAASSFVGVDWLVVGTIALAYPASRQAMLRAMSLAADAGAKIALDVNWRESFWPNPAIAPATIEGVLGAINLVKLAREEAQWLFGTIDPTVIYDRLQADPRRQRELIGVCVSAGEAGCGYHLHGYSGYLPAFAVAAIDTTGAGDGFLAGSIVSLSRLGVPTAENVRSCMRYAAAVGAMITLQPGAIASQPSEEEVVAWLAAKED
jgi:fructokinase